jgi:hypothetical protein
MKSAHLLLHFAAIVALAATAAGQTINSPNYETSRATSAGKGAEQDALAAVFVVTSTADSGAGSFRQAVLDAPAGSTISFNLPLPAIIPLTTGQIVINKSLIIQGPGSNLLTVRNAAGGGPTNRIFMVSAGPSTISGLTVKDGNPQGHGGGIWVAAELTLNDVTVTDCQAPGSSGGGILSLNRGLVLNNCTISNNTGYNGGGLAGPGTINNSTITGNVGAVGGGLWGSDILRVNNSTISGNTSRDFGTQPNGGGGIYSSEDTTVTNSTISNNVADKPINTSAGANGGGICVGAGTLTVVNSTIANNTTSRSTYPCSVNCNTTQGVGGGIWGPATVRNSIIAANTALGGNSDYNGTLTSQGYNLVGSNFQTTITGDATGNLVGTNANPVIAQLAALAANGGATRTRALLANSPAINSGNAATSPAADQRGFGRNGTADKGAFEFNGVVPAPPIVSAVSRKTHGAAGAFDIALPLSGAVGVECRVPGASGTHTIVITFANNLASVNSAVVTGGTGSVSSSQIGSNSRQYVINLTGVANAQRLTVTMNNVTDSSGYTSSAIPIPIGFLQGDTNGSGGVTATDIGQVKAASGQTVDGANFRQDVNISGGSISASDIGLVKAGSGSLIPAP